MRCHYQRTNNNTIGVKATKRDLIQQNNLLVTIHLFFQEEKTVRSENDVPFD